MTPVAEDKEAVVYFGPMGCQTGFYFLFNNDLLSCEGAIELLKEVFNAAAVFDGEMPGKSAVECGNYINLDLALANICKVIENLINSLAGNIIYICNTICIYNLHFIISCFNL